jgi:alkylation response protein AidB-like acyl-CoA dehydrogenase
MVQASFFSTAELLEEELGDPCDADQLFSFPRAVALDEREEFPREACQFLDSRGIPAYYVPARYGGTLQGFDEVLTLLRVIARRDLSVAIAHSKTFLGSAPVWIAGSMQQRLDLARRVLRGEAVALALTEEAHGSDLAASDCLARKVHQHYLLSGTKWLVNNATRSSVLSLLCRSRAGGGPLGTSLFSIAKEDLDASAFTHLPKIKTHGIRAIDISGIHFEHAVIQEDALIGKEHHGLEYLFKTFQITRPLCSGLSLGAADTALRLTLQFARERRVYGDTVFAIPAARQELVGAFVDLLMCECLALFSARALHVLPEQMSVWSAVTKYVVPTTLEDMVRTTATILGARYYLREHYGFGMFQKIVRDIAIVSLFDGSTRLNLSLIASQLGQLAQRERGATQPCAQQVLANLSQTCALEHTLPEFDPGKLALTNRGRDALQAGLLLAAEYVEGQDLSPEVARDLGLLLRHFAGLQRQQDQAVCALLGEQADLRVSAEASELSKEFCLCHTAAACFYLWVYNRHLLAADFASGEWLVLCLHRLAKQIAPQRDLLSLAVYREHVAVSMLGRLEKNCLFSLFPVQLAPSI